MGKVVSVLDYAPNVPDTVNVVVITDDEFTKLDNLELVFNPQTMKLEMPSKDVMEYNKKVANSNEALIFLKSTDWMIMRHQREKTLNIKTSLTDIEILELERKRWEASLKVYRE